ncbi:MAG: PHP domain-containing protein, partial [Anaerolineae bacterium]
MSLLYLPAEFHLHTVLSACAEIEMIPPLIIRRAQRLGITWLAVTDHNSAENAQAMMEAGARAGIAVLPGMEVQT